mmetsp:Transcript_36004/g.114719  ORF Transcript_36004/g.114719 Transcript_36004/m.114719 type:complete len:302 (-) Transcript_36004:1028-1933(-)
MGHRRLPGGLGRVSARHLEEQARPSGTDGPSLVSVARRRVPHTRPRHAGALVEAPRLAPPAALRPAPRTPCPVVCPLALRPAPTGRHRCPGGRGGTDDARYQRTVRHGAFFHSHRGLPRHRHARGSPGLRVPVLALLPLWRRAGRLLASLPAQAASCARGAGAQAAAKGVGGLGRARRSLGHRHLLAGPQGAAALHPPRRRPHRNGGSRRMDRTRHAPLHHLRRTGGLGPRPAQAAAARRLARHQLRAGCRRAALHCRPARVRTDPCLANLCCGQHGQGGPICDGAQRRRAAGAARRGPAG